MHNLGCGSIFLWGGSWGGGVVILKGVLFYRSHVDEGRNIALFSYAPPIPKRKLKIYKTSRFVKRQLGTIVHVN